MSKVILVGTISNAEKKLEKDLYKVLNSLYLFEEIDVFLVESDSSDSTIAVIDRISEKNPKFHYVSLGNLKITIPNRIERIRKCRNEYIKYIRLNFPTKKWDYVVVADLDGMNSALKSSSISKLFASQLSWDACFPNQKHGYYDLYALREETWMPRNCFTDLDLIKSQIAKNTLKRYNFIKRIERLIAFDQARKISLYDKMRVISKKTHWIKVDSAFGGLGIYKSKWFLTYDYSGRSDNDTLDSEHVDFHLKCREAGAEFFIVPSMINSNWNEYNVNRYFIIRQLRQYVANHKNVQAVIFKLFRHV
ncbi:MAG: hypothetical protein F2657_05475 [Actinobacteria bacterium]|uniref:Unannotated protein n=1 Tax=freshwater metagenome TaxID=449393 RepID=A0A6J6W4V8_9ZZZZ|nr:hypothetical protein [Actinomycetota bacterium]MSY05243.1 hypothetical protein [Actinomycetota bacterium]MSY67758.1 hypothetical protein [Actinomycetota bacterium]MTA01009.1 hypothetical protein [Actinomycetota bacterium]